MELKGERVVLRPVTEADVPLLVEIQAKPSVARWWDRPDAEQLRKEAAGETDATVLAITVDGAVAGLIQYYEEDEPMYRHASIDLFLSGDYQGRGLGTDAVRTLARHLIDDRGHHRLTIDPSVENAQAIRA